MVTALGAARITLVTVTLALVSVSCRDSVSGETGGDSLIGAEAEPIGLQLDRCEPPISDGQFVEDQTVCDVAFFVTVHNGRDRDVWIEHCSIEAPGSSTLGIPDDVYTAQAFMGYFSPFIVRSKTSSSRKILMGIRAGTRSEILRVADWTAKCDFTEELSGVT